METYTDFFFIFFLYIKSEKQYPSKNAGSDFSPNWTHENEHLGNHTCPHATAHDFRLQQKVPSTNLTNPNHQ